MKVISILNRKGGVGKTSTALNLSCGLSRMGYRTLLIDLDSQANLSQCFNYLDSDKDISYVLNGDNINNNIQSVESNPNLSLITSSHKLSFIANKGSDPAEVFKLKNSLASLKQKYDFVVVDNSPSFDILTYNSLIASDYVSIILQSSSIFSVTGLDSILDTIEKYKQLNAELSLLGIIFNMVDNTTISKDIIENITEEYKGHTFKSHIRKNIAISEAQASRQSIFDYNIKSNGAIDFQKLTEEFINRINHLEHIRNSKDQ